MNIFWYADVRVVDPVGAGIASATVNATNVNGTLVFNALTDSNGYIYRQTIQEYFHNQTILANYTPHVFSASKNQLNSTAVQVTKSTNNVLVLAMPLTISNVRVVDVTQNTVTIGWDSNRAANETVEYGLTTSYGSTYSNTAFATAHSAFVASLTLGTTYHYRIQACDTAGNCVYSSDYSFTTAGGGGGGTGGGSGGGWIPTATPTTTPAGVSPSASYTPTAQPTLIGGEKDAHGCLVAAGYSWCEAKQKCLRVWKEECGVSPTASPTATIVPAATPVAGGISPWSILLLVLILLLLAFLLYKRRKKKRGS